MSDFVFNLKNINTIEVPESGYRLYKYDKSPYLCLKVTSKGTKTYIVRFQNGSKRSVGKFSDISLSKAKEKADDLRQAFAKGFTLDEHNRSKNKDVPTFLQMSNKYLKWSEHHKKESTVKTDKNKLKNHVIPYIGHKKVNKITTRDISSLLDSLKGKENIYTYIKSINGVSIKNLTQESFTEILVSLDYNEDPKLNIVDYGYNNLYQALLYHIESKTIVDKFFKKNVITYSVSKKVGEGTATRVKAIISHMFKTAMTWNEPEWECITNNPCISIKSSQSKSKERYLDKVELNRLYNVLETDEYLNSKISHIVRFLLATGARKSEATNARWEHIDFSRRLWRKPKNDSKTKLTPPVPLSPPALRVLQEMYQNDKKGYIFKSETNPNKPIGEFRKSFNTLLRKAEVDHCTPHDLRRTYGSILLQTGSPDIFKVSKLLGHKNVSTTQKHYAFLDLESLHDAVDALDGIMR